MEAANTAPQPWRRRRWQFSLRSLLLAMLVASVVCWPAWRIEQARRRHQAAEAIQAFGGAVHYDYQRVGNGYHKRAKIPGPAWVRNIFGDDLFINVVAVDVPPRESRSDLFDLELLASFSELEVAKIDCPVVNDNFGPLARLYKLKKISLMNATDAGLKQLGGLQNLTQLSLSSYYDSGERLSDSGIVSLAELPQLEELALNVSKFSDGACKSLAKFPALKKLTLGGGLGMGYQRGLHDFTLPPTLQNLTLRYLSLSDEMVEAIRQLPSFQELEVNPPTCARLEVEQVGKLQGLKFLRPRILSHTDQQRLKDLIPNLQIVGPILSY